MKVIANAFLLVTILGTGVRARAQNPSPSLVQDVKDLAVFVLWHNHLVDSGKKPVRTSIGDDYYWMGQIKGTPKGCVLVFGGSNKLENDGGTSVNFDLFDADNVKVKDIPHLGIGYVIPNRKSEQDYWGQFIYKTGSGGDNSRERENVVLTAATEFQISPDRIFIKGNLVGAKDYTAENPVVNMTEGSLEVQLDEKMNPVRAIGKTTATGQSLDCEFGQQF